MTIPFTYLIGWTRQNLWYYGVRFAENCAPSDLWSSYFTSSELVSKARAEYGEPDRIEIRKTFSNPKKAKELEDKVLSSIPKEKRIYWLNQVFSSFRGVVFTDEIRRRIGEASTGRPCTPETRAKISKSMSGIKRSEEVKIKVSNARKAVLAKTGVNPGLQRMHSFEMKMKAREKLAARSKGNSYNKGRIWIRKDGKRKMIYACDMHLYLQDGWVAGYK